MTIWYPYFWPVRGITLYLVAVQYEQAAVLPRPNAACGTAVEKFQTRRPRGGRTGDGVVWWRRISPSQASIQSLAVSSTGTLDRKANTLGNRACGITGLAWLHATHNTISGLLNSGSSKEGTS
ncbi:hypothetical protein V8C40DRAFT_232464 [Trichoderma camerunense]